jgi:hypothetical protein
MKATQAQPWIDADQARADAEAEARAEFHRAVAAAETRLDAALAAIRASYEKVIRSLSVAALARRGAA